MSSSIGSISNFQPILIKILSDPDFTPPENLLDFNLRDLGSLLESCPQEVRVRFAINEARLVLPIWENEFPSDLRPKKAIKIAEEWIKNPRIKTQAHICDIYNVDDDGIDVTYYAYYAAYYAAYTVNCRISPYYADNAAWYARKADCSIVLEDQLKRLFEMLL